MMRKFINALLERSPSKQKILEKLPARPKSQSEVVRITCILIAIVFFVTIALVTTLAILGVMKTIYVWALLTTDINEEQMLIEHKLHNQANIQKLNKSLDRETMYSSICLIVAGFGFQLSCACIVLLYGLLTKKAQAIYAWIIFSCTNLACLGIVLLFMDRFTKIPIDNKGVDACLEGFAIAVVLYDILLFYHSKSMVPKKEKIVVKAYGGYTHTVSPNLELPNKPAENYIV